MGTRELPETLFVPKEGIRTRGQAAERIFSSPSEDAMAKAMLLVRSEDPVVQPYVCPSGTAEKDMLSEGGAVTRSNFFGGPTTSSARFGKYQ
jgi:hypothetical protein